MNDYFFQVQSRQKLKELRNEGMTSQEFHRLGGSTRPALPRAAALVALMVLILQRPGDPGAMTIAAVLNGQPGRSASPSGYLSA